MDGPTGISSAAEALVAAQENGTPTSQTPGPKDVSMTDAPLEQSMVCLSTLIPGSLVGCTAGPPLPISSSVGL